MSDESLEVYESDSIRRSQWQCIESSNQRLFVQKYVQYTVKPNSNTYSIKLSSLHSNNSKTWGGLNDWNRTQTEWVIEHF
jgi:hypothetical protein